MKLANQKMDLSGFEALDTNYNDKIDTDEATHVLDITGGLCRFQLVDEKLA